MKAYVTNIKEGLAGSAVFDFNVIFINNVTNLVAENWNSSLVISSDLSPYTLDQLNLMIQSRILARSSEKSYSMVADDIIWVAPNIFNKNDLTVSTNFTASTNNASPTVAYSYAVGESKCIKMRVEYTAYKTDFSLGASGDLFSTFIRAAAGNIIRSSGTGTGGLDGIVQGNFPNAEPKPDLVANTSTQSIDVTLTGKASTSITWQIKLTIIPYS